MKTKIILGILIISLFLISGCGEKLPKDVQCAPLVNNYTCTIVCKDMNFTMNSGVEKSRAIIPTIPEMEGCETICDFSEVVGTACYNITTGKPVLGYGND